MRVRIVKVIHGHIARVTDWRSHACVQKYFPIVNIAHDPNHTPRQDIARASELY